MAVIGLGCRVNPSAGWCVRSTGYGGGGYSDNEDCTITNPPAVPISVTSFAVESDSSPSPSPSPSPSLTPNPSLSPSLSPSCPLDRLTVNGARYCGSGSPEGVVPDGTPIQWYTDGSATFAGWELCFPPTN